MLYSGKARENGESYARRTAERAAAAIARRRGPRVALGTPSQFAGDLTPW
jgi:hypothetical protein